MNLKLSHRWKDVSKSYYISVKLLKEITYNPVISQSGLNDWHFRSRFCSVRLYWARDNLGNEMSGVLGHNSAVRLYWARDNLGYWEELWYESFGMNHALGAGSIAQPVNLQSTTVLRLLPTQSGLFHFKVIRAKHFTLIKTFTLNLLLNQQNYLLYLIKSFHQHHTHSTSCFISTFPQILQPLSIKTLPQALVDSGFMCFRRDENLISLKRNLKLSSIWHFFWGISFAGW